MPPAIHPDAVGAARAGAGWAFEHVYRALAPAVTGYLRAQGLPDPEAGAQEVFLRAFRAIDRFTGDDAHLRSWVFAIAHNVVVDHRRFTARRPPEQPLEAAATAVDVAGGDAEGDALGRLATSATVAFLGGLPPDQRDVLLLRFVADLPLDEVADAMGRTVGAVKALQHRALAAARRRIAEIGVSRAASGTFT